MTADRPSLRTTLLRRVLPTALIVALGGVAVRVCNDESASWTLELDLGAAGRSVESLRVDLYRANRPDDDPVAYLERSFGAGGAHRTERQTFHMAAGDFRADIVVQAEGRAHRISRTLTARKGDTARLDLEAEILGEAPP